MFNAWVSLLPRASPHTSAREVRTPPRANAQATQLAKEGYIVAATEKGENHGHAALLTGKERDSGTWKGRVPEVYGSVNGKPAKSEGISIHWQAKDKNNIEYKVYRYKRPI